MNFDRDYKLFSEYMTLYVMDHPEYQEMMKYVMDHKAKTIDFTTNMFLAWRSGKIDWFMQNRLLDFEKTGIVSD